MNGSQGRADLLAIFNAALAAVEPKSLVSRSLAGIVAGCEEVPELLSAAERIFVLAVGKGALKMAAAAELSLTERLESAIAIFPSTAGRDADLTEVLPHTGLFGAAHPVPDASSLQAAQAARSMLAQLRPGDLLITLISGGASALLAEPADRIALDDKIALTMALLRARASIKEINIVRKHLSALKGGQILRLCQGAKVLSLIISDVRGNDLATIGSGLTAPDPSTFEDARAVLIRHRLWGRTPESVREHLEAGAAGVHQETPKPGDPLFERVINRIIGDNAMALEAGARKATAMGYQVDRWRELYGEARDLGRALAAHLTSIRRTDPRPDPRPDQCVICGGEPVVTVKGNGRGGRAQELALSLAIELARLTRERPEDCRIMALCAGTDGQDGPTDAAGAFADPGTIERIEAAGISAEQSLARNNSYPALEAAGDLLKTGLTGTNVADIFLAVVRS